MKHSCVFADLFSIPHPSDEPTVEGCPIVELQDTQRTLNMSSLPSMVIREFSCSAHG
ncbi:hypothetical protein FA13DRAFT_932905 [Coprinellus micaceus]|uniref:Uncharacterized protein n=1 Tax=Coprinellus micaceus TaxID=71717 RepID=A0A4Y7T169_COPMI|nr:hypothetical protein FA13DRAFT_932905 [Coprinellus micaceus]